MSQTNNGFNNGSGCGKCNRQTGIGFFGLVITGLTCFILGCLLVITVVPNLPGRSGGSAATASADTNTGFFLDENTITNVAESCGDSVVGISTTVVGYDMFYQPTPAQGVGSGFLIDTKGHILTNAHVISGATKITVTLADGSTQQAEVVGSNKEEDIAVLKISGKNLKPLALGNSSNVKVGQLAIAIGNPLGLELQRTVTAGIISAIARSVEDEDGNVHQNMFQTDASINPGNSGGPLLNSRGQVIAINTAKIRGAEGIGFAIPINTAKSVAEEIIAAGKSQTPWIGISGRQLDQQFANYYGLALSEGIVILQIVPGGPADDAGFNVGDIIVSLDNKKITTMDGLKSVIQKKKSGQKISYLVNRGGKNYKGTITLGSMPN